MIIVRIYEGLGNQLFQYAYARAISLSTNQKVFLDARETGSRACEKRYTPRKYYLSNYRIVLPICTNVLHFYPYINGTDQILEIMQNLSVHGCLPYKFFKEDRPDYNETLVDLKGNWYLQGWFQDSRYFQKYESIIKKEIVPKNRIKIRYDLKNILKMRNTVSVHIRRGDYKKVSNAVLPINYYNNAMEYMRNNIDLPYWVVFSDDINWVKENMDFGTRCYFLDKKDHLQDYEEMMVMSCCKNHIIANSTFSWWGAWLGRNKNKIVIGPDRWILNRVFDYDENILPEDWVRLHV